MLTYRGAGGAFDARASCPRLESLGTRLSVITWEAMNPSPLGHESTRSRRCVQRSLRQVPSGRAAESVLSLLSSHAAVCVPDQSMTVPFQITQHLLSAANYTQ